MKIKKIIFWDSSKNEETAEIILNKNNLIITGGNQTGKTTVVSLLQILIGYEKKHLGYSVSIEPLKGKYLKLNVENDFGEAFSVWRTRDMNNSIGLNLKTNSADKEYTTFLNMIEVNSEESKPYPNILDYKLLNNIKRNINDFAYKKIAITEIGYLFYLLQDDDAYSSNNSIYTSNMSKFFTLLKLTTNEFDEDIKSIERGFQESKRTQLSKNLTSISIDTSEFNENEIILMNSLIKDRKLKQIDEEHLAVNNRLKAHKRHLDELNLKLERKKIESYILKEKINTLIDENFDNYLSTMLNMDMYNPEIDNLLEIEIEIEKLNKDRDAVYKDFKISREQANNVFKEKNALDEISNERLNELVDKVNQMIVAKKEASTRNSEFDLSKEISKIEDRFMKEYVNDKVSDLIDSLESDFMEYKNNNDLNEEEVKSDLELFNKLKYANYRIFNSRNSIEEHGSLFNSPQGAMKDVHNLLKILLNLELVDDVYPIPYVIIDTPFKSENKEFYEIMPALIIKKIMTHKKQYTTILSTVNESLVDLLEKDGLAEKTVMENGNDKFVKFK